MESQSVVGRIDTLEEHVTRLEELPHRIDDLTLQVLQLREEMRTEFSVKVSARTEMRALNDVTLRQMRVLHEDVIARLGVVGEGGPERPAAARRRSRKR